MCLWGMEANKGDERSERRDENSHNQSPISSTKVSCVLYARNINGGKRQKGTYISESQLRNNRNALRNNRNALRNIMGLVRALESALHKGVQRSTFMC
jgi:hypothetical protein